MAAYIVGTPIRTDTPSRLMISSARTGSNLGSRVRHAPEATAQPIATVWPKEWNSGSAPSTTSRGPRFSSVVLVTSTLASRLAWVSSAPFGCPVVPDVYRITAVSEGARSAIAGAGPTSARVPARSEGSMMTRSVPALAAPLAAWSATPCQASASEAAESDRW